MIGDVVFYPNYIHYVGYTASAEPSITGETYESSGGETSGPAYDLVDNKRSSLVTLDTASQTTNPVIDFDLASTPADAFDFMIIDNHNLFSAASKAVVRYGGSPGDTTLDAGYEASGLGVTTSAMTESGNYVQAGVNGISVIHVSAVTSAYWDLYIDDTLGSLQADITMGEIAIGKKCAVSVAPDMPTIISNFDGVSVKTTAGGQKHGFSSYNERKAWKLTWPILEETDFNNIKKVWQVTNGPQYPFYIDLGEASTPKLYYVRFLQNSFQFKKLSAQAYELSIIIESET